MPGPSRCKSFAEAQIRRHDTSEPSGNPPGQSRIETIYSNHRVRCRACIEPSAEAQIHRSDTSEASGKLTGLSPIEMIYASHRARHPAYVEPSAEAPRARCRARHRARLDLNHPPKQYTSEPSGKPPGPSRGIRLRASRHGHGAVYRAIRRASHCRGAACDLALKPQTAGAADIQPNPLDYSL